AIIFFFSAFEPPHVEPDWSLVYPELAGMYTEEDKSIEKKNLTEELDKMLEEAKIGPALISSLGAGLNKLNETTSKLSDVSNASVATNEYVQNIKGASKSAGELTNSYNKTAEALSNDVNASSQYQTSIKAVSQSANELAGSYNKAAENFKSDLNASQGVSQEYVNSIKFATKSANDLAEQYSKSAESLTKSAQAIDFSAVDGKAYGEQVQKVAQNLTALNSVYELQLKGTSEQLQATNKLQETLNQFMGNLTESSDNTMKFKNEIATLNKNLSALNNVYGNMLAAMNVNVNR
ncbi:MAG: gliding motility protein GldL, partial [Bacteroidetes bacterium]|nr:gliding motility protein GldL [Bacteroidota bacterium]